MSMINSINDIKGINDMLEGIADTLRGNYPLAKASRDTLIELLDAEQGRNAAKFKELNSINDLHEVPVQCVTSAKIAP